MTLRVFEAFSGCGSQSMALKRLRIDFKVVGTSEIDIGAITSYNAIHGDSEQFGIPSSFEVPSHDEIVEVLTKKNVGYDFKKKKVVLPKGREAIKKLYLADLGSKNLGDISKLRLSQIPEHDLFTYSFPCTDISIAGKQDGLEKDSETRSSLLWECERIIRFKRPKYLMLENVKNLVGKKHKENFDKWLKVLEGYGYKNYWKVVNARDHLVPQNRERVFVISIYGDGEFKFPEKQELTIRLKDVLEQQVDEKYYLSEEIASRFVYKATNKDVKKVGNTNPSGGGMGGNVFEPEGVAPTLTTNKGEGVRIIELNRLGGVFDTETSKHQAGSIWDDEGLSPTLDTMQGGWRQPCVLIKNATKTGYLEAIDGDGIDLNYPDSDTRRGRVQPQQAHTITTSGDYGVLELPEFRIRKLTPLECWRLMDVSDSDFYKAKNSGLSDTQLYKLAGNSIVVNVLCELFKNLFIEGDQ